MITEGLLTVVFGIADGFFALMPTIEWSVDTSAWEFARDIFDMIAYLLPWGTVTLIGASIITLTAMRIFIAVFRSLKGMIPFI